MRDRFLIDACGPDDDAVRVGFRWLVDYARDHAMSTAAVLVPGISNAENLARALGDGGGRDPLTGAKAYIEREGETEDPRVLVESPCALFARSAAKAAAEIERRRARWGFTSMTTFGPSADALSAVLNELR